MLFTNSLKLKFVQVIILGFGLLLLASPVAISAGTVTIRVVNGRNGHPIPDEKLQLWINNKRGSAMSVPTDKQGIAKLDVPPTARLILSSNLYIDCRYSKQTGPERPAYPVSEILQSGVLAANTCGKLKIVPVPGELIFFVRPEHWWEGMGR